MDKNHTGKLRYQDKWILMVCYTFDVAKPAWIRDSRNEMLTLMNGLIQEEIQTVYTESGRYSRVTVVHEDEVILHYEAEEKAYYCIARADWSKNTETEKGDCDDE